VSFHLVIRPEAEADMAEGFEWYETQRNGLGHDFLAKVRAAFQLVCENPNRHAVLYRDVRRTLTRRFPYKVFYLIADDSVEVIAVVHARRNPAVWQERV